MTFDATLGYLILSLGINAVLFVIAFSKKSDKLTDLSYATSFIAIAVAGFLQSEQSIYHIILLVMTAAWSARLGAFLLYRILRVGKDQRFDGVRENFLKFGKFWLGQAVAAWVIMLPSIFAFETSAETSLLALVGVCVWAVGLTIETQADLQKIMFRNNPANKGKWIASGLWKYSRHPNYFGEITIWFGVYLYALSVLPFAQAAVGIVSPLLIASILIFVSGIPPLEKYADEKWGNVKAYRRYKAQTSILVPLPPRGN